MNLGEEVTEFITDFLYHQHKDEIAVNLIQQFRCGYCYHFAMILKHTFHRGSVCWAAPFGHIVWQDIDQTIYDIEGKYSGEAFYFIPIEYLGESIRDFLHISNDQHDGAKKSELIDIVKKYCEDNNIVYNKNIESYFQSQY